MGMTATMLNVSSVCSENARRHGAAVGALGMPDINKKDVLAVCPSHTSSSNMKEAEAILEKVPELYLPKNILLTGGAGTNNQGRGA